MSSTLRPPTAFLKFLAKGCDLARKRPIEQKEGIEIHYLDLTSLGVKAGRFTPFVFSPSLAGPHVDATKRLTPVLETVSRIRRNISDAFVVFLFPGSTSCLSEDILVDLRDRHIALLDASDMGTVSAAASVQERKSALVRTVVRRIGRTVLSPYDVGRPVHGASFFGRSHALRSMLDKRSSFTVLGNRRIGKTSMLRQLKYLLQETYDPVNVVDLDGSNCVTTLDAVLEILSHLDPRAARRIEEQPSRLRDFPGCIQNVSENDKIPTVLFVDELDHILKFDARQHYQLLALLRSAFSGGQRIIFLAGFREAMEAKDRIDSPLYNFTQNEFLSVFTRRETVDMISRPLELLDVPLPSKDCAEVIYRETGGHPELVQICCAEMIRICEEEGHLPGTDSGLLARLLSAPAFDKALVGAFLANTNPLEYLLSILLMRRWATSGKDVKAYEFGYGDIRDALQECGIQLTPRHTHLLAHNLLVAGIIIGTPSPHTYRFAVPHLANTFQSMDVDAGVKTALEHLRKCDDATAAVWAEPVFADTTGVRTATGVGHV